MHPIEFMLQMQGIAKLIGDGEAPTPAQWAVIREALSQAVGTEVAKKMLEAGEQAELERQRQSSLPWFNPASVKYGSAGVFGSPSITSGSVYVPVTWGTTTGKI